MKEFHYGDLKSLRLPMGTVRLISKINEYKGKEQLPTGETFVRFIPLSAFETPEAMNNVYDTFREQRARQEIDSLILISTFVLDFLYIHPFDDGNGRMARLLTLLLLYIFGYEVGRYISLEKIIEESKETYYETLRRSSIGCYKYKDRLFIQGRYS